MHTLSISLTKCGNPNFHVYVVDIVASTLSYLKESIKQIRIHYINDRNIKYVYTFKGIGVVYVDQTCQ